MIVRRFQHDDIDLLLSMAEGRGLARDVLSGLPVIGYIALGDIPLAAAFLRRCEGGLGILEGLISNVAGTSIQRHLAIDLVVKSIVAEAASFGISSILSYSVDDSTIKRSSTHGFRKQPHTLITLDLGETYGISGRPSWNNK